MDTSESDGESPRSRLRSETSVNSSMRDLKDAYEEDFLSRPNAAMLKNAFRNKIIQLAIATLPGQTRPLLGSYLLCSVEIQQNEAEKYARCAIRFDNLNSWYDPAKASVASETFRRLEAQFEKKVPTQIKISIFNQLGCPSYPLFCIELLRLLEHAYVQSVNIQRLIELFFIFAPNASRSAFFEKMKMFSMCGGFVADETKPNMPYRIGQIYQTLRNFTETVMKSPRVAEIADKKKMFRWVPVSRPLKIDSSCVKEWRALLCKLPGDTSPLYRYLSCFEFMREFFIDASQRDCSDALSAAETEMLSSELWLKDWKYWSELIADVGSDALLAHILKGFTLRDEEILENVEKTLSCMVEVAATSKRFFQDMVYSPVLDEEQAKFSTALSMLSDELYAILALAQVQVDAYRKQFQLTESKRGWQNL